MRDIRFERPPVRGVTLCVYFTEISALQVSHLSSLRELWRDAYPTTRERPPLTTRFFEDVDDDEFSVTEDSWFFPYLTFFSETGDREIAMQPDRFLIAWSFAEEDTEGRPNYPGYKVLRAELAEKWQQFADAVKAELGIEPKIGAAECRYRNVFGGLNIADLQVGLLTGWSSVETKPILNDVAWSGLRMYSEATAESDNCATLLLAQADYDTDATLIITVDRDISELPEPEAEELGGIDLAHDQLIERFLQCSNASLRQTWGEQA